MISRVFALIPAIEPDWNYTERMPLKRRLIYSRSLFAKVALKVCLSELENLAPTNLRNKTFESADNWMFVFENSKRFSPILEASYFKSYPKPD